MLLWVPIASAQQTSAAGILQPVAGSTVVVKMIDAVDSSSDPAGKQYRATVTEPVNAGNNVIIGQGSVATVTLARNGSGWVAQLTSLVINGQSVAVTTSSAPVTSAAQNAVGDSANALRSVLGRFGRGANLPSGVAAVATGARVILPPGTSLSFVLDANPPPNAATPAAPTQARNQPQTAAAATAQSPDTSITGVYNGTYICTRVQLKLKLVLIAAPDASLTGFFIVEWPDNIPNYPPPDSGSRFTYKLNGRYVLPWATPAGRIVGAAAYVLTATPWGTPAPSDCAMGQVRGRFSVDSAAGQASDRITGSIDNPRRSDFHLFRDKAESPTAVALAAESEPPTNDRAWLATPEARAAVASAAAARAAELRAAAPAQLASQGLVRKSKAYWDAYQTDLIRQVFDGGFGDAVDSYIQFRVLFDSYVDMFSKNCSASLPAHHEAVTVTQVTTERDRYGNVVSQVQGQSYTVEVDSRFAPYYREYHESLATSAAGLALASGRVSANTYLAPGLDMAKFVETESCKSAAMRQLGENLLRAANGNPSLQQDGATIAGAAAETDTSLPPGRYARFVDGCNGFFRDPANPGHRGSQSSAWCDCLGEKYRRLMTRDEDYYYANDFKNRFWSQIAQPRSTDPASPRLHPAVADCVDETHR
jgi:hypothetical protein